MGRGMTGPEMFNNLHSPDKSHDPDQSLGLTHFGSFYHCANFNVVLEMSSVETYLLPHVSERDVMLYPGSS